MNAYSLMNSILMDNANMNTNNAASNLLSKIIGIGIGVAGGILALLLVISIVKDGIEFHKGNGNGSWVKIISKVLFFVVCIGLVIIAANWQALGNKAAGLGNNLLNAVENFGNDIVGP